MKLLFRNHGYSFFPQSLTNADVLGQGNLNLVSENSGKSQGILLSINCGNSVKGCRHAGPKITGSEIITHFNKSDIMQGH